MKVIITKTTVYKGDITEDEYKRIKKYAEEHDIPIKNAIDILEERGIVEPLASYQILKDTTLIEECNG